MVAVGSSKRFPELNLVACSSARLRALGALVLASETGLLPSTIRVVDDGDAVTAHAGLPLVLETRLMLGVSAELGLRECASATTVRPTAPRPSRLRFSLAARITSHAGSLVMKIGRSAKQLADLVASRLRLARGDPRIRR